MKIKNRLCVIAALFETAFLLTACGAKQEIKLIEELPTVNFDVDSPVGQITKDVVVTQSFISNCNEITSLQIYGATYIRENTATVKVRILLPDEIGQEDGTELACFFIDSSKMEDNTIISLPMTDSAEKSACVKEVTVQADINKKLAGKPCLIEITSPDGEPNMSPTFWMTQDDIYADGALSVAGFEQYNDLWFQVEGIK